MAVLNTKGKYDTSNNTLISPTYETELPPNPNIVAARVAINKTNPKVIQLNNSNYYFNLGMTLSQNETILLLPDGKVMNNQQLYLKAIQIDPNNAKFYLNLGTTLSTDETITLPDGTVMNNQQLYLKAIQLNPNHQYSYHNLGLTLSQHETITLLDGKVMNKRQLYLKAIQLDPNFFYSFNNLGMSLSTDETITLLDGTVMNQKQLFLKSIQLEPNDYLVYKNLGNLLLLNETITFLDGTVMNQKQIFLKSIQLEPNDSDNLNNLGKALLLDETITLPDGTEMNKQQLNLKAIQLDQNNSEAYYDLGEILSPNESITLHDGTMMNKQQLLLKSIQLNPKNFQESYQPLYISSGTNDLFFNIKEASAMFELSELMSSEQCVEVNGNLFSKDQLFEKAIQQSFILFREISFDISNKEKIGIGGNGRVYKAKLNSFEKLIALKVLNQGFTYFEFIAMNEVKCFECLKCYENEFVKMYGFCYNESTNLLDTIVMELMSHSLHDEIYKYNMSIQEEEVISSVAKGLKILSDLNFVHRDIKPKNILIGFNKEIKIGDFGLIDLQKNLNSKQNPGTDSYQAPELRFPISTHPITIATDIFSLGITIIEMNNKEIPKVDTRRIIFDESEEAWTWKKKPGDPTSRISNFDIYSNDLESMTNEKLKNIAKGCIQDDPYERLSPTDILNLM